MHRISPSTEKSDWGKSAGLFGQLPIAGGGRVGDVPTSAPGPKAEVGATPLDVCFAGTRDSHADAIVRE